MTNEEIIKLYPKTELFEVTETIGVPHPFCITAKLVTWTAKNHNGRLTDNAIREAERQSMFPLCGVKGCSLKYDEHKQALAVLCKTKDNDLLQTYLKSIVEQCEKDGFAGFVLVDGTGGED